MVLFMEEQFVLACLFKWKPKCKLKNGMLCSWSDCCFHCQDETQHRGQHVIALEAKMLFAKPGVWTMIYGSLLNRDYIYWYQPHQIFYHIDFVSNLEGSNHLLLRFQASQNESSLISDYTEIQSQWENTSLCLKFLLVNSFGVVLINIRLAL